MITLKSLLEDRLHRAFCGKLGSEVLIDISTQARKDTYRVLDRAAAMAVEDLAAHLDRDPALMAEPGFALVPNSPFMATLYYRLAHILWNIEGAGDHRNAAYAISHYARAETGAEIHPGARIGRRFILDHGTNTVIGATTSIGDDCYVLNGVVLGARGIAGNADAKRHPTIGNRVQIGSFARILGDVHVGDDAFIGPHSCVQTDVQAGGKTRSATSSWRVDFEPRKRAS